MRHLFLSMLYIGYFKPRGSQPNIVFEYEELERQFHLKIYLSKAANYTEPSSGRTACISITYLRLQMFQGFIQGFAEGNSNATASFQATNFMHQSLSSGECFSRSTGRPVARQYNIIYPQSETREDDASLLILPTKL